MSRPIVSKEQLIKAAGLSRFERAESNFDQTDIKEFHYEKGLISARVEGFEAKVRYVGEQVEGACNCEDSDGFDFCEHCVQLTLHANKVSQQLVSLSKGPDKSKVLAYLINMDKQALAKQFLELIEDDNDVFQRYLLKASLDQKGIDYTALKSRVTELTRLKEKLFSQRQVKHFFARIELLLEEVALIPATGQEEKLLKLIEYAFQRMNALLDKIEDRANQRATISNQLNTLYSALFLALSGRPETLAKRFYSTWINDRHRLIEDSLENIRAHQAISDAFIKLCKRNWADEGSLKPYQKTKLSQLLKEDAERSGNFEDEQLYRVTLAKTSQDWAAIAQRWIDHKKYQRAATLLESHLAENKEASELLPLLIETYQNLDKSLDRVLDLFRDYPAECIDALLMQSEKNNKLSEIQQSAIQILEERNRPEEVDLLLHLYLSQEQLREGIQLTRTRTPSVDLVISLARKLKEVHPEDSVSMYQNAIEPLLKKQLSKSDRQAAELLYEVERNFGQLRNTQDMLNAIQPLLRSRPNVLKMVHDMHRS